MSENKKRIVGGLFLAAGILLFAAILLMSFLAAKSLQADYLALKNHDVSEDAVLTIGYDDRIYASIGAGIEIDSRDSRPGDRLSEFIASSLRSIDNRILSCGILYTMMTAAVLAYPLCRRFGQNKKRHVLSAALSVFILYAVFFAAVAVTHAAFRVPFRFPAGKELLLTAVSLLAVAGGSCFLAWLLRTVRRQILVSVVAVPVVFGLFLFGATSEGRLYCAPTVDSFDFLTEIDEHVLDEDYTGDVYYDEEKNVVVLNGTEYPPEQADNPDYLKGFERAGAYAFELLDPYGGNSLFLTHEQYANEGAGLVISPVLLLLYALKALAWVLLPLFLRKKT